MTVHDFAKDAMASSGRQLDQVLAGMKEEHADTKVGGISQSPRETLEHLTDCYVNTVKAAEGKQPEWGTFSAAGKTWNELQKCFEASRAEAVAKILAAPEDKVGELALNYVILHDAYHVGQLALIRIQTDPGWDAYSIYA
jgi:uncharacterized damage-inducible protein DinB